MNDDLGTSRHWPSISALRPDPAKRPGGLFIAICDGSKLAASSNCRPPDLSVTESSQETCGQVRRKEFEQSPCSVSVTNLASYDIVYSSDRDLVFFDKWA